MTNLKLVFSKLEVTKKRAAEQLLEKYPVGSTVYFRIMPGQVNPSSGVVRCACGWRDGCITVFHNEAKTSSRRYQHRTVHFSQILEEPK